MCGGKEWLKKTKNRILDSTSHRTAGYAALARRKRWSRWTPSDTLVKGGHMALADLFTLIEVFSIFLFF